jgi:hypothetical protein
LSLVTARPSPIGPLVVFAQQDDRNRFREVEASQERGDSLDTAGDRGPADSDLTRRVDRHTIREPLGQDNPAAGDDVAPQLR